VQEGTDIGCGALFGLGGKLKRRSISGNHLDGKKKDGGEMVNPLGDQRVGEKGEGVGSPHEGCWEANFWGGERLLSNVGPSMIEGGGHEICHTLSSIWRVRGGGKKGVGRNVCLCSWGEGEKKTRGSASCQLAVLGGTMKSIDLPVMG